MSNSSGVGDGVGGHARSCGPWLTASRIKKTEGSDIRAGVSMDQVAAKHLGKETQLSSLELSLDSNDTLGACDSGYSCAYTNTISWRDETTPMPMESDPRAVFERLFGAADSTDPAARQARLTQERSILDLALESVARLKQTLGVQDQLRVNQYLEGVRETERRIQAAEAQSQRELPVFDRPGAAPDTYETHCRLMLDLLVLAFQTDMTRVSTFMMSKEQTGRAYPEIGVPDGHHPVSHHQNDPVKIEKLAKINTFHMLQFTYFLEKLRQHAGRRRDALRSLALRLWLGDERQQPALPARPAHVDHRRRRRDGQGRAAYRLSQRYAGGQSLAGDARQGRCADREVRRQHGKARVSLDLESSCRRRGGSREGSAATAPSPVSTEPLRTDAGR